MDSGITIAQLRHRIDALKRRLALPYAVVRITPLADDLEGPSSTDTVSSNLPNPYVKI